MEDDYFAVDPKRVTGPDSLDLDESDNPALPDPEQILLPSTKLILFDEDGIDQNHVASAAQETVYDQRILTTVQSAIKRIKNRVVKTEPKSNPDVDVPVDLDNPDNTLSYSNSDDDDGQELRSVLSDIESGYISLGDISIQTDCDE